MRIRAAAAATALLAAALGAVAAFGHQPAARHAARAPATPAPTGDSSGARGSYDDSGGYDPGNGGYDDGSGSGSYDDGSSGGGYDPGAGGSSSAPPPAPVTTQQS